MDMATHIHKPNTSEVDTGGSLGSLVSQASQAGSSRPMRNPLSSDLSKQAPSHMCRCMHTMQTHTRIHTCVCIPAHTYSPHKLHTPTYAHTEALVGNRRAIYQSNLPGNAAFHPPGLMEIPPPANPSGVTLVTHRVRNNLRLSLWNDFFPDPMNSCT